MNTTIVFAELLIIGIQGSVWIGLIVLSIFGYDWIRPIPILLSDWTAVISIVSFAAFYSIGVVLDRIFDASAKFFNPTKLILVISWVNEESKFLLTDDRVRIHSLGGTLSDYQHYILSRLRIARATFYNVMTINIAALFFVLIRLNHLERKLLIKLVLSVLVLGAISMFLCLLAWAALSKTYEIRSRQILSLYEKKSNAS